MYQHHIQLRVGEMLTASEAIKWYHAVEEYGPESIVMPFMHNGNEIAMEYGIADGDEFEHCYTVPLKRDLTTEETAFIIGAWEYMFTADFDIEISNQYNAGMMGDFENSFEIDPEVKQMAIADMSKNYHNRWVEGKIAEGWRHGAYYNSREKTHPALRNWDILPESHKRSPEFTDQEIYEWVLKKQGKFVEGETNRYVMTPHQNLPNTKSMTGGTTMVTKGFRDMQQAQARTQAAVDARQGAGQSQIGTAPKVSKTDFSPNVFPRTGPKKPRN